MAMLDKTETDTGANASIYALRDQLEAARLEAITQAAAVGGGAEVATDVAARIGHLHMALLAVRDAIEAHTPKLGAGSEQPLQ